MPTCGGLRIGVLSSDPKTPPLVMVNVPPLRSASDSEPSSARLANSRMPFSISREGQPVGVAQHRHDQTLGRADGDADVVVVLQHHLVALDLGVDAWEAAQCPDRRLDEKRRDPEADAMPVLERLLVALAQRHHGGHVHLVEGGEHRRRALGLDEPPGNRGAALRHPHPFLGAVAVWMPAILDDGRDRLRLRRGAGAGGVAAPAVAACSTSRRMTRPPSPLPRTRARSTALASAAFFAVGVARGVRASLSWGVLWGLLLGVF